MPRDTLPSDTEVQAMVRRIDPDWTVTDVMSAEGGYSEVYRLRMQDDEPARYAYLKASTVEDDPGVGTDARVCRYLDRESTIPVPTVLGVIDEHDEFSAPYYLMTAMDGDEVALEAIPSLEDDSLRTTASVVGRFLGELHALSGLDAFGHVRYDPNESLDGGRPEGTAEDLTLRDPFETWSGFLEAWCSYELDRHRDTRFGDLTPDLERWIEKRLPRISDPHGPVIGRNDHGFHNVLIDRSSGTVTGMLDWAYTLSVTPAFDVAYAVYLFAGAFMIGLADVDDRRASVHDALVRGYARSNPDRAEAVGDLPALYQLLPVIRAMNDFEPWAELFHADDRPRLASGLRSDARSLMAEQSL